AIAARVVGALITAGAAAAGGRLVGAVIGATAAGRRGHDVIAAATAAGRVGDVRDRDLGALEGDRDLLFRVAGDRERPADRDVAVLLEEDLVGHARIELVLGRGLADRDAL